MPSLIFSKAIKAVIILVILDGYVLSSEFLSSSTSPVERSISRAVLEILSIALELKVKNIREIDKINELRVFLSIRISISN